MVSIPLRYADNQDVPLKASSESIVSIPLRYADNIDAAQKPSDIPEFQFLLGTLITGS